MIEIKLLERIKDRITSNMSGLSRGGSTLEYLTLSSGTKLSDGRTIDAFQIYSGGYGNETFSSRTHLEEYFSFDNFTVTEFVNRLFCHRTTRVCRSV